MANKRAASISDRLPDLENRARKGLLDAAGFEALSEACFRVALLPGQRGAEAVRLLRRAVRSDGTNPKHAYFLARIYFAHGDFDRASRWLREAARHCPTSHRIWSHIALLQRELNQRYSGNDAYEPDDLRFRSAEILRRVLLGNDSFTADLLEFRPRESTKKKRERKEESARYSQDENGENRESIDERNVPEAQEESSGSTIPAVFKRLMYAGCCRWSGAADLTLEAILEGTASELICQKARPLLQQVARLATERQGGAAAFAILAIDWCIAGLPVETVEHLRRTLPPDLDVPSLQLLDFICRCFRVPENEVSQLLADALDKSLVPPTLAAVVHHHRLLWQSLDPRIFSKHSAGRRWLARNRDSKDDVTAKSAEVVRAITQAAASFAQKPRPVLIDSALTPPTIPTDLLQSVALIEEAATRIAKIADAAVAFTAIHPADCTELVRALEKAAERASSRLDDLLVAAFEASQPAGFGSAASKSRRTLNRILYLRPLATRFVFPSADGSARQGYTEIADWFGEAEGIFAVSSIEISSSVEQLEALEASGRESKARLDSDLQKLKTHFESKNKAGLGEKAVAECLEAKTRSEQIIATVSTKIRETAELRASGKLRDWTPEEIHSAQNQGRSLPPSEVARLDEVERTLRGLAALQGPFRRIIAQLDLPKPVPAEVSAAPVPAEEERSRIGISAVEKALSRFAAQVESRFAAALETFTRYTPSQRAEPALASLIWSVRARQAEALFRLGQKGAARRVWVQLLGEDRFSLPVLKNIAVSLTGGSQAGFELSAWRDYAEMLYFHDCIRNSPRPNAAVRAAFHQDFGSTYAPACFLATKREGQLSEADENSLLSFLESPSRVRVYVTHKQLEWFNRKLDFASPTLLLGCERNEHESTRALAKEKLLMYCDACCSQLPKRARESFRRLSCSQIEAAHQKCNDLHRILEDSAYTTDHPRQLAWAREIASLKLQIADCILNSKELPRRISSPLFLEELLRLDEVPMDLSPNILSSINPRASALVNYMTVVQNNFLDRFTQFLDEESGDESLQRLRERQFSRLIDQWLELPSVRGSMPVIQFLIKRLEGAIAEKQYERVCEFAILVLRADDRRANVARLVLVKFLNAAEEAQRCMLHRELAAGIAAWMTRARAYLASHAADKEENNPLSEDALAEVNDDFLHVLLGTFLAPHVGVRPEERMGRLEKPLDQLVREHPIARPVRMLKYWEFAGDASKNRRRDELVHWVHCCKPDVEAVLSDPSIAKKYREIAERIKDQIQSAGI